MIYYLARRFLGLYPWEWDRLPWWTQKIYREGMSSERPWVTMPDVKEVFDPFHPKHGAFMDEDVNTYEKSTAGLATMGFKLTPA